MKLLATQIAIGKGADCENIRDARFDAAAQKIVALAVRAAAESVGETVDHGQIL